MAALALLHGAAQADDCLNDWGIAGEIVRRENLITVEEVAKALADDGVGQIVRSTLCRQAEGYVYRLVIRAPGGQLRTSIMQAKAR